MQKLKMWLKWYRVEIAVALKAVFALLALAILILQVEKDVPLEQLWSEIAVFTFCLIALVHQEDGAEDSAVLRLMLMAFAGLTFIAGVYEVVTQQITLAQISQWVVFEIYAGINLLIHWPRAKKEQN